MTELLTRHRFFLVQRLMRRQNQDSSTGFYRHFRLDYMGSAEFEWGAVPESLQRIRAAGVLLVCSAEITRQGVSKLVYFVGPSNGIEKKVADFKDWFAQPELYSLEWTGLHELFTGDTGSRRTSIAVEAWWSLEDDIVWTLNVDVAKLLLEAFALSS